ncbi:UbiX family flavin prenyltransferase [Candidatus Tisiphia endosymbiont of Nemotelus uliginosus]|uniref:UbiX family flavin prenyltransferase n=1 Tax=Candidatus Tisiphia endosymbiont of Nemotelus uliginosus TaxID=3077926 RepID=UPI0035C932C7
MHDDGKKKIIVAISGASGAIYGIRLLEHLNIEIHLAISKTAHLTISHETNYSIEQVISLADYYYNISDIGARICSGSFLISGMIIAPCSMTTLASIAGGLENNLITRAAGVALKERKKLALMTRESPLHLGHLDNMLKVTNYGGIIVPPVPSFYQLPQTLDDIINHSVGRILDLFELPVEQIKRWSGLPTKS